MRDRHEDTYRGGGEGTIPVTTTCPESRWRYIQTSHKLSWKVKAIIYKKGRKRGRILLRFSFARMGHAFVRINHGISRSLTTARATPAHRSGEHIEKYENLPLSPS